MCLDTIDKEPVHVTEGWKIFNIANNELYGAYISYKFKSTSHTNRFEGTYIETKFETNKWIKDTSNEYLQASNGNKYKTGFHFYFNKKDAEDTLSIYENIVVNTSYYKIFKIKVRNVVATGIEGGILTGIKKVGVAREIFIEDHN